MDKVTIQFEKLKSQGKINIAEKVKISDVDNFNAGLGSKTIKYNAGMNKLQDDEINFFLLHEEGHFDNPQKIMHYIYLLIILFLSLIPFIIVKFYLFNGTEVYVLLLIVSFFLIPLIFTPLACIWMKRIQQNYEYEADDFACKKIDNPFRIESAFKQARYHSTNNKKWWQKIFLCIICSKYSHPSDEDRINRMKKNHNEIIVLE